MYNRIFQDSVPYKKALRDFMLRIQWTESRKIYYTFYVLSVISLEFVLWNTLKMATGVAETCRCQE
jgi:hypothetical protein